MSRYNRSSSYATGSNLGMEGFATWIAVVFVIVVVAFAAAIIVSNVGAIDLLALIAQ